MIYFRAIQDIKTDIFNQDFDEIWFCVNSIRSVSDLLHKTPKIKWIPELAPDDKLFSWYKERKNNN